MLSESRLYSFLDSKSNIALHFLDGQKLIQDLALTHHLQGEGFRFFRNSLLSIMPIISFLKPGESLGIYLDSTEPFFRLKIETNHSGFVRTLLLPEDFIQFPEKVSGLTRVTKLFPHGKNPYTSIVHLENENSSNIMNRIIQESYQASARTLVSEQSDQSVIFHKLPQVNVNSVLNEETPALEDYMSSKESLMQSVFAQAPCGVESVVKCFEKEQFAYLSSRQITFYCPCSKERMEDNLRMLYTQDPEAIFDGKETLEAKCDYCKKAYIISRADLKNPAANKILN
jgi:molecular chaperone Hsp33